MQRILFESPVTVYLMAGLAELITAAVWQRTRARRARVMLIVWPALAVGVGILAAAVTTDREKVEATWQRLTKAVNSGDAQGVMACIAEDFSADGMGKDELGEQVERAAQVLRPDEIQFLGHRIERLDDRSAEITITAIYRGVRGAGRTRWSITFGPAADGAWRTTGASCLEPSSLTLRGALRLVPGRAPIR